MPITPMTGRLAVISMLIVLAAMASLTRGGAAPERASTTTSNAAYIDRARTDMIAGCTDKGAPRSYCECVTSRVLERSGRDATRLRAMEAQLSRLRPGSPPPPVLVEASQACAAA